MHILNNDWTTPRSLNVFPALCILGWMFHFFFFCIFFFTHVYNNVPELSLPPRAIKGVSCLHPTAGVQFHFQFNFSVSLKFVTASYIIVTLSMVSGNGNIHDYITRCNKTKRNWEIETGQCRSKSFLKKYPLSISAKVNFGMQDHGQSAGADPCMVWIGTGPLLTDKSCKFSLF